MRRIAVINQKGGVGKTTTTVNLGAALALMGERVLLIDLDPQGHLTLHLGLDFDGTLPSTYDLLTQGLPLHQVRRAAKDNLWCVGSNIELAAAEPELIGMSGREMILRDRLDAEGDAYDYVLIDCPPSLGLLTLNALAAVREVFVPLEPHFLALQGLGNLLKTVNLVSQRINPQLRVSGILLCKHESSTRLAAEVVEDIKGFLELAGKASSSWASAKLFETKVRRNIKLAECPSHGLTIFDYAPKSNGALDYAMLASEITGKPMPAYDTDEGASISDASATAEMPPSIPMARPVTVPSGSGDAAGQAEPVRSSWAPHEG